jgi:excisionase family DNA binding protein
MERILLTPMEAADALHIGRTKIYDLIRNGELTSIKIGKLRRVPVDAVREYARKQLVEAAS